MGAKKRILVVDDSMAARMYVIGMLPSEDFEIYQAKNGREALELIEQDLPDGMLLDLLMPEMDGFELLQHLKTKNISIPVIIVSADVQQEVKDECMELGAAAFLNKPVDEEALINKLNELIA